MARKFDSRWEMRPSRRRGPIAPWLLFIAAVAAGYAGYQAFRDDLRNLWPKPEPESARQTEILPLPAEGSRALADRPSVELGSIPSASSQPPAIAPKPELVSPKDLPSLEQSDPWLRAQLVGLSQHGVLQNWLRGDKLLHKAALMLANFSEGRLLPLWKVGLTRLSQPFAATPEGSGQKYRLDPAGYTRYRSLIDAIDALDDAAVAAVYRRCKPLLQTAYAELGNGRQDFDRVLFAALERWITAHPPAGPYQLVKPGVFFKFADAEVEKLAPIEKQLIRMGPANADKLQSKLKRLRAAILNAPAGGDDSQSD